MGWLLTRVTDMSEEMPLGRFILNCGQPHVNNNQEVYDGSRLQSV